jgi:hypothetical protein
MINHNQNKNDNNYYSRADYNIKKSDNLYNVDYQMKIEIFIKVAGPLSKIIQVYKP